MVDPGEDFQGYMEKLEERRRDAEQQRAMWDAHEVWRQTTWGGWLVRQLQALGNHLAPFFIAVHDSMTQVDSTNTLIVTIILRVLVISAYVVAAYALAQLVQMLVGREIVVEQEVIVEVEVSDDEAEADEGKETTPSQDGQPRRSARQRKRNR